MCLNNFVQDCRSTREKNRERAGALGQDASGNTKREHNKDCKMRHKSGHFNWTISSLFTYIVKKSLIKLKFQERRFTNFIMLRKNAQMDWHKWTGTDRLFKIVISYHPPSYPSSLFIVQWTIKICSPFPTLFTTLKYLNSNKWFTSIIGTHALHGLWNDSTIFISSEDKVKSNTWNFIEIISLYVCKTNNIRLALWKRKYIIAKLSIRKLRSS